MTASKLVNRLTAELEQEREQSEALRIALEFEREKVRRVISYEEHTHRRINAIFGKRSLPDREGRALHEYGQMAMVIRRVLGTSEWPDIWDRNETAVAWAKRVVSQLPDREVATLSTNEKIRLASEVSRATEEAEARS